MIIDGEGSDKVNDHKYFPPILLAPTMKDSTTLTTVLCSMTLRLSGLTPQYDVAGWQYLSSIVRLFAAFHAPSARSMLAADAGRGKWKKTKDFMWPLDPSGTMNIPSACLGTAASGRRR